MTVQQLIDNGDVERHMFCCYKRFLSDYLMVAPQSHRVNLLCGGEPQMGTYVVEMHGPYGDGWQTDDSNGGSGMTVTLLM